MASKRKVAETVAVQETKITEGERETFDSHNDESASKESGCICETCKKVWATL